MLLTENSLLLNKIDGVTVNIAASKSVTDGLAEGGLKGRNELGEDE